MIFSPVCASYSRSLAFPSSLPPTAAVAALALVRIPEEGGTSWKATDSHDGGTVGSEQWWREA